MAEPPHVAPSIIGAPRSGYAKGVVRRRQILERAIAVFAERGSDRTSLRAIAEAVGVTHAALRHYFGSLEELLVEVYRESERQIEHATAAARSTPVEVMRQAARRNREVPGLVTLYSLLISMALEDGHPSAREFAVKRFAHVRAALAEHVRRLQALGHIRAHIDPHVVAALVIAASDGLQTQWLLDPAAPQDEALDLLDAILASPDAVAAWSQRSTALMPAKWPR
ncbi:TetR/AcrR family transcriptional regulator [Microbacterium trichothecenolyticum]|uniref:TetR/AcrR family transcriptional regulator n=1 Tax=Microbacterium trichothecenolyticum TaxID=69370 RepID=UPI001C6E0984|nr:TetR/AcrR family transcriptional regulator [Microbacterium trichothecenolyticum]MBW9122314.1 TetR/AcrR family transcriptional regulator [Microbacterium trichothecenolyticum]